MKIQVYDIPHIINQIKRASPPKDKETHKMLNNLAILLEKNTTKKHSQLESALVSAADKLHETVMDLCFVRKEIVKKFGEKYYNEVSKVVSELKQNRKCPEVGDIPDSVPIEWDLNTMEECSGTMPVIFSKLQKAKSVIEDAIKKNEGNYDPERVINAFFNDI